MSSPHSETPSSRPLPAEAPISIFTRPTEPSSASLVYDDPFYLTAAVSDLDVDHFTCLLCHMLLQDPVLSDCGRLLCADCHNPIRKHQVLCRDCNKPLMASNRDLTPHAAAMLQMANLTVRCPELCGWVNQWGKGGSAFKEHIQVKCSLTPVRCIYYPDCEVPFMPRKDQAAHTATCPRRPINCPDCTDFQWTSEEEKTAHLTTTCPSRLVPCSNADCGQLVRWRELTTHLETSCPHEPIPCTYCAVGQELLGPQAAVQPRLKRKDRHDHLTSHMDVHELAYHHLAELSFHTTSSTTDRPDTPPPEKKSKPDVLVVQGLTARRREVGYDNHTAAQRLMEEAMNENHPPPTYSDWAISMVRRILGSHRNEQVEVLNPPLP